MLGNTSEIFQASDFKKKKKKLFFLMVCFTRLILNCHSEKDFMANSSSGQSVISKKPAWFNSFMYAYQNCWLF